jgi:hypothetical protein
MSGGADAVRVFESKAQLTPKEMSSLRGLVATIAQPADPQPAQPDQKRDGFTSVVIMFADGTSMTFFAKGGQRFHPDTIQTIWDTISKYSVGAW